MSVVRVVVVRTGGFAGIERRAEVDDPDRAAQLSEAVRSGARGGEDRSRDGFVYTFTLVTASGEERVDLGEGTMSPDLRTRVRALFA